MRAPLPESGDVLLLPSDSNEQLAIIIPSTTHGTTSALFLSYQQLNALVLHAQQSLACMGVGPGKRVAVALPNGLEFVVLFLATVRQRAAVSPLNPASKLNEHSDILAQIQPCVTITPPGSERSSTPNEAAKASRALGVPVATAYWDGQVQNVVLQSHDDGDQSLSAAEVVEPGAIHPHDIALLHFTSGTTGTPKAVGLTHEIIRESVRILAAAHELSPTDRCMVLSPFYHVSGTSSSLLCALFSGGCAIIPPSLPGNFWHQLKEYGATWYQAVPTMHRLLLSFAFPAEPPSIRFVRVGAGRMPETLAAMLEQKLGCPVLESYGMTETAQGVFCNGVRSGRREPGTYAIPVQVEVRILAVDDGSSYLTEQEDVTGEICIRGKCVIQGYLDNPAANEAAFIDGFFRTGDLGKLRPNGYLQVTGRLKEMINKGGEKVSPLDIDQILLKHEGIHQAASFRVPDEIYGENIGVAIVMKKGHDLKALEIKRFVRQHASDFKVPKTVVFVDAIPVNKSGKFQRDVLEKEFGKA